MKEPGLIEPDIAEIVGVSEDTYKIKTFTIKYLDREKQKKFFFMPGKFLMVTVFGFGEMPISISSSPLKTDSLQLTVKDVGTITHAMQQLKKGDKIGLRGPFGKPFTIAHFRKKNILFVSGGCGMAPLRPIIYSIVEKRGEFGNLILLHGCKNPDHILFNDDLKHWDETKNFNVLLTVDECTPDWKGHCGPVTDLLGKVETDESNTIACIVGLPIMVHLVLKGLRKQGFKDENIFASLERLMHCGMGKCAHCNIGSKYVCIDGPVFSGKELAKLPLEEK